MAKKAGVGAIVPALVPPSPSKKLFLLHMSSSFPRLCGFSFLSAPLPSILAVPAISISFTSCGTILALHSACTPFSMSSPLRPDLFDPHTPSPSGLHWLSCFRFLDFPPHGQPSLLPLARKALNMVLGLQGLSASQFGENLQQGFKKNEPEDHKLPPSELLESYNFTEPGLDDWERLLQSAQHMAAVELAADPGVRQAVRRLMMEHCRVTTQPTSVGEEVKDPALRPLNVALPAPVPPCLLLFPIISVFPPCSILSLLSEGPSGLELTCNALMRISVLSPCSVRLPS